MNKIGTRIVLIAALGISAPIWWTSLVSKMTFGIFVAGGSPEQPSSTFSWFYTLAPSLFLGLVVGLVLSVLAREFVLTGWLLFWIILAITTLAFGFTIGVGSELLEQLFRSAGNLIFLVAALFPPLAIYVRTHRI